MQVFDLNGKYLTEWKFAGLPCGLYLSADGQLYLASGFAGQILRLDANGKAIAMMGQPGKGLGDVVDNPLTPEIEGQPVEPADDYPEPRD